MPFSLEPLTNSAGPWVLVAFGLALTASRTRESLLLAVVSLLALVFGFYVAQDVRGWAVSRHQVVLWLVASFVAGPLVGVAAGWLRHAGRMAGALGAGVLGGLLVGEAVYGLTTLKFSTPAEYWHVQLVLGVGAAVGLPLWRSRRDLTGSVTALAVSIGAAAAVGAVTCVAYQVP